MALTGVMALVSIGGCGKSPVESANSNLKATVVGNGVITGRVLLKGNPPPEKELPLDPTCTESCRQHYGDGARMTRLYVSENGGLGDVVVMLTGVPAQPIPEGTGPLVIDQKGCEYTPYVAACQCGQTIEVRNSDPLLHNVHTTPKVNGNREFNKGQAEGAAPLEFVYQRPEEFLRFKCDVHPWMFSYVSIVEHPFFDVTGPDGSFEIKGLPDGQYQVKVHHRKAGELTQDVEVRDGKATTEFTLTVPEG